MRDEAPRMCARHCGTVTTVRAPVCTPCLALEAPPPRMRYCRACEVWHDGECEVGVRPRSILMLASLAMVAL